MDYYYHYVPGRLRIQTPFLHGSPINAEVLTNAVKSLDGIKSVETNPVTGSALFHFDESKVSRDQIVNLLEKEGYFVMSKAKRSNEVIEQAAEKVLEVAEKIIVSSVEGGAGEG